MSGELARDAPDFDVVTAIFVVYRGDATFRRAHIGLFDWCFKFYVAATLHSFNSPLKKRLRGGSTTSGNMDRVADHVDGTAEGAADADVAGRAAVGARAGAQVLRGSVVLVSCHTEASRLFSLCPHRKVSRMLRRRPSTHRAEPQG